jgi:hypothetical protein
MQSRHTQVYLKLMSLYTIILMFAHCLYNPLEILDFFNEFLWMELNSFYNIVDYIFNIFTPGF